MGLKPCSDAEQRERNARLKSDQCGIETVDAAAGCGAAARSNRTNVGLKRRTACLRAAVRIGSNRTNVGLKPQLQAAAPAAAQAQIGPMWD